MIFYILKKIILYWILNIFIKGSKDIQPKTLLLIRLDGIGDYVLFRNYIQTIKKNKRFKNFSITLLGNISWKNLSEELDIKYIDKFLWLDRKRFENNFFYRYKKLKELSSVGYQVILSPIYSRNFFIEDTLVNLIYAKEKIGSSGNYSNIKKWEKKISDKYYSKLIYAKKKIIFEFCRNKEFFQNFFNYKLSITKPNIQLKNSKTKFNLPKKYAVFFIGGSQNYKKWSIKKFAKVGKFLKKNFECEPVLCGDPSDLEQVNKFQKTYDGKVFNLVGKTSLIEFLKIIKNAFLILSNESSAPHFAAALNIRNVFVLYAGKYLGRFYPYPKKIFKNYIPIYHPYIERNVQNYKKLSNDYKFHLILDINEISFEKVEQILNSALKKL